MSKFLSNIFSVSHEGKYKIIRILGVKITLKEKKKSHIDIICWWIPFRETRNAVRCVLNELHALKSLKNDIYNIKNQINYNTDNKINSLRVFCNTIENSDEYKHIFARENPLVSVIIPVYNVEQYLRQCLDSVVNQTLRNIEIICVNDGSTDGSLEILKEYAKDDSRIIVIDKENEGVSATRNKGIETARGEYIGFVDSDDWIDLNYYEVLYNAAKIQDADLAKTTVNFNKYNNNFSPDRRRNAPVIQAYSHNKLLYINDGLGVVWNSIYKLSYIKKYNLVFDNTLHAMEDVFFTAQAIYYSKKSIPVLGTNYNHRNENGLGIVSASLFMYLIKVAGMIIDFINLVCDKSDENYLYMFNYSVCKYHGAFKVLFKNGFFESDLEMMKSFDEISENTKKCKDYEGLQDINHSEYIVYFYENNFDAYSQDYLKFI